MLMTCTVEPGALVDANCIDDQSVALPLPNRISVPSRIVFRIGRMIAAIGVNQSKNMLGLAEDCDDIGTLNNHRWMRPRRHSRRAWWQALRIRILCMIDVLISLSSVWCQDELFSRQCVFCNVIHRPTKPDTGQVRMTPWRLRIALIPPRTDSRVWFTRLCSSGLRHGRRSYHDQENKNCCPQEDRM